MIKKILATAVLGLLAAGSASAATVSFSFTNPRQVTEISQSGNLGLFDSTLGVLTGVSLTLTGESETLLTLRNNASQAQTARATGTTDLFFGSSIGALDGLLTAGNPLISLSASTGFQTLAAGATSTFGPLTDTDQSTLSAALAGITGSFAAAGGGTFSVSCFSLSGLGITGGGGNIAATQETTAACGASIEYTYTARPPVRVPEPATLALLGLAVVGAGVARRKFA